LTYLTRGNGQPYRLNPLTLGFLARCSLPRDQEHGRGPSRVRFGLGTETHKSYCAFGESELDFPCLRFVSNESTKARIFYARRQFPQALKLLQEVLKLNPDCQPDPRVGIGLCLWAMDHKQKARAAWQRSLEVVSICSPCWCILIGV
jgi:hypothetical protein